MRNFAGIAHALVFLGHWLRLQGHAQKQLEEEYSKHMKENPIILYMSAYFALGLAFIVLGLLIATNGVIQTLMPDSQFTYHIYHGLAIMFLGFSIWAFRGSLTRLANRKSKQKDEEE